MADSLIILYNSRSYADNEIDLIKNIAIYETNPDVKLYYCKLIIEKGIKDSLIDVIQNGYSHKGDALKLKGSYVEALEAYFKSLEFSKKLNDQLLTARTIISVADTYSIIGNTKNAEIYYKDGIDLLRETTDSVSLASALLNFGDEYFSLKKYRLALQYFDESGKIFEIINFPIGKAYNLGNVGMVYAEQGKDKLAEKNINEAIKILEELEDYYPISVYLTYMADIYVTKKELPTALNYAERSLLLANKYGLKDQISAANFKLSELYEISGNYDKALLHFKNYKVYKDSIINIETVQKMANQQTEHEVSQKQVEVDLLNQQKKNQSIVMIASIITLFLIGIMAIGLFKRNKFIKATNKVIEKEKERSDELLLNILPEETAVELKEFGKVKSQKFNSVTVLFTDFEGFTNYSEHLSPEELVETVDFYFSKFDKIIEKYKLEKIKTIGDAYMCAGGLPFPSKDHAHRMVLAAFEIAKFVEKVQKEDEKINQNFSIRIGINTGPVVSGVVGSKKFAYDIWGDTVNIASRMESNSEIGKINISENTHELIKNEFNCEYRGEIDAKNKGKMKMYFVNSLKETNKTIEHVTTRS